METLFIIGFPFALVGMPFAVPLYALLHAVLPKKWFPSSHDYVQLWAFAELAGLIQCVIAGLMIWSGLVTYGMMLIWLPSVLAFFVWLICLVYEQHQFDKERKRFEDYEKEQHEGS